MIILHLGVRDGDLLLWGETPAKNIRKARRNPNSKRPPTSPFDAGATDLIAALGDVVDGLEIGVKDLKKAAIWLPTIEGQPVASSPLIAEPPNPNGRLQLVPWSITALPLTTAEAVDIIALSIGKEMLAPGIALGKDFSYWATALRFSAMLVARGQFLPDIQSIDGSYYARWTPVFIGDKASRLSQLAAAMPSVCRALGDAAQSPTTAPRDILVRIVEAIVDYLVRSAPAEADETVRRAKYSGRSLESVHDRWLHALSNDDSHLYGGRDELGSFAASVREWRRPIAITTETPFRLCFRLEEPDVIDEMPTVGRRRQGAPESESWSVRYLLQAVDDQSLFIAAADAWQPKGRQAKLLHRKGFKPREYLLAALGQAATLIPQIDSSLKTSAPDGYRLDTAGAHEFLRESALLLEGAGFKTLLPSWWSRHGTKKRISARAQVIAPQMKAKGHLSLDKIIDFQWEVALGDQTLTPKELADLARLKAPLIRLRGQWVELNAAEIKAAIAFWQKKGNDRASARDLVRMAFGAGEAPGGLTVEGVTATGWLGDLLAQLEGSASFAELPAPDGFKGVLRPYQTRGYSWLAFLRRWGLGACLADDMGLGKTVQALALIERDWEAVESKRPVLLICPTSVVGNWQKEAQRFTPTLPVMVHHGIERKKGAAFKKTVGKQAIVVSSYALLHRDLTFFKDVEWAGVILDEAQNIKNAETKQAKAARELTTGYRLALTGTPVENNVGDLWSIMEFLNPGLLGTQAEFKRSYFIPIQARRDEEAAAQLKRLTGPFILRRLKTDRKIISDLPEKMEMKVYCTLTQEQASLYAAVVKDLESGLETAEGIQRKGMVLAALSKLKQVCNHPAHFLGDNSALKGRSGKLARLAEMLEEALAEGDRALVFTQFAEMGTLLKRHLEEQFGRETLFLYGGTPKKQRDEMVARFQEAHDSGPQIFILSLKAGGTGLNLTAANHVFHFDRWWNPAVENQATDRAFRIGQGRRVQVHKFLCAGTLEEKIDEMIESKQEVAARVVGTGEAWLTELSNSALRELFALRRESVGE
jgi:SNF2 family DNA or RNA helicase